MDLGVVLRETLVEKWIKPPLERWYLKRSVVPTTPFLDPTMFEWVADLENAWPAIRAEYEAVSNRLAEFPTFQQIQAEVGTITDDDHWKTYFFMGFGHRGGFTLANCPQTAAALEKVPGLTTAFFSIFEPGKYVAEHRGPYRGILRYHLGLKIPDPPKSCGIRVGSEVRHWQEGSSLIFDDCYPHEAWNESNDTRVVLFLDFARPMRFLARWFNRLVLTIIHLSPPVKAAKRSYDEWERQFSTRPE